jgi:hypothetical protein
MNRRGFFGMMAFLACGPMPAPSPWPSWTGTYPPTSREELIEKIKRAVANTTFNPPLGAPKESVLLIERSVLDRLTSTDPG